METKRIKVVKNWLLPKSICDIQNFLGFANFYQQFIQSFCRITVQVISILKTTGLFDKLAFSKSNNSRLASNRNENSRLAFGENNSDNKVDELSDDGVKYAKKSKKLKG